MLPRSWTVLIVVSLERGCDNKGDTSPDHVMEDSVLLVDPILPLIPNLLLSFHRGSVIRSVGGGTTSHRDVGSIWVRPTPSEFLGEGE